jgi:hypothetical protein
MGRKEKNKKVLKKKLESRKDGWEPKRTLQEEITLMAERMKRALDNAKKLFVHILEQHHEMERAINKKYLNK